VAAAKKGGAAAAYQRKAKSGIGINAAKSHRHRKRNSSENGAASAAWRRHQASGDSASMAKLSVSESIGGGNGMSERIEAWQLNGYQLWPSAWLISASGNGVIGSGIASMCMT